MSHFKAFKTFSFGVFGASLLACFASLAGQGCSDGPVATAVGGMGGLGQGGEGGATTSSSSSGTGGNATGGGGGAPTCKGRVITCGDACVDPRTDAKNCGVCGNAC